MPTRDELFYWEQRRKAAKKQRDQSQRQAALDRAYALRASAVMEAELARLMAIDDVTGWDDGAYEQTTGVR